MRLAPLILVGLMAGCSPKADPQAQAAKPPAEAAPVAASAAVPVGAPRLAFPLDCVIGQTCEIQHYTDIDPGPGAKDYRCGGHTYQDHGGADIRLLDLAAQRRGVDVLAAAAGTVSRLRDGVADVSVRLAGQAAVAGQECGNGVVIDHGGGWETQYCHLAQGSIRVRQGDVVAVGQPIARVGLSGNTEYPHLHLSVRRNGVIVEPFRPEGVAGSCDATEVGPGLWTPEAAKAMAYQDGAVLNVGFAAAPVTMEAVETGGIAPPTRDATAMVAYVRAIGLEGGDIQSLTLADPSGATLAQSSIPPLDRAKAQYMMFVGKRPPAGGWASGRYVATYVVTRAGRPVLTRQFALAL